MDYMLQKHCSKYLCSVPDGLKELMMDITREVLRSEPEDLCTFIADYLDALVITREHARVAARVVASLVDASATISDLLQRTGMTKEQAEAAAEIIQTAFREHAKARLKGSVEKLKEYDILQRVIETTKLNPAQAIKAAIVIQTAFKAYMQREQSDEMICVVDASRPWMHAARNTLALYEKTKPTETQMKEAATTIQAIYKGYHVRKNMLKLKKQAVDARKKFYKQVQFESWVDDHASIIEPAARVVQNRFRQWKGLYSMTEEEEGSIDEQLMKRRKELARDPQAIAAATLIQRSFRAYLDKLEFEHELEQAATVIQRHFREWRATRETMAQLERTSTNIHARFRKWVEDQESESAGEETEYYEEEGDYCEDLELSRSLASVEDEEIEELFLEEEDEVSATELGYQEAVEQEGQRYELIDETEDEGDLDE